MSILPASGRFVRALQRRMDRAWRSLERPGVFLSGSRFLHVTGTGTRPVVHLPCQESSGCPMNVTSVLLNLHAGLQNNKKQIGVKLTHDSSVCVWSWLPEKMQLNT